MNKIILCFLVSLLSIHAQNRKNFEAIRQKISERKPQKALMLCYRLKEKIQSLDEAFQLGNIFIELGKIQEGIGVIEKMVVKFPSYKAFFRFATLADKKNIFDLAIKYYKKCLTYYKNPDIYQKLSMLFEEKKEYKKSLSFRSHSVFLELPRIRSLPFKKVVEIKSKNRKSLKKFLIKELDKEFSPKALESMESTLKIFGLIPKTFKIKTFMTGLLTEQVGGFYNPETKNLYLIEEKHVKSFWQKLMGTRRDDAEDRMVIAHEMTHAIQDQYFDLTKMTKAVKNNDDKALAFQALVEGDASVAMLDYNNRPGRLTRESVPALRMTFRIINSLLLPFVGGKELSKAPNIIKESLLFPYMEGLYFCLSIREGTGWKNINAAYKKTPQSTEQILHPEKYLMEEKPKDCQLKNIVSFFSKDWKEVANNVMGEFTCLILFQEFEINNAKKLATGWGGDRYVVLNNKKGESSLVWLTNWDTPGDMREFFDGYKVLLKKKYPKYTWKSTQKNLYTEHNKKVISLELLKDKVVIIEQVPLKYFAKLRKKLTKVTFR